MAPLESNTVTLLGFMIDDFTFSHTSNNENFFTFILEVERISGTKDYVPVIISEKMIDRKQSYIGKPLCVVGQFRSHNKKADDSTHLLLHVFAIELYIAEDIEPINNVSFSGFLCKKPTYRKTPLGRQIADMMIAVPRMYGKSDYIPCIAWGRNAIYASQLDVGEQIHIAGRIQSREYQKIIDDVSETRTAYEVSIIDMSA